MNTSSYTLSQICRPIIDFRNDRTATVSIAARWSSSLVVDDSYQNAISFVTMASHNSPKLGIYFKSDFWLVTATVASESVVVLLLLVTDVKQVRCKADTIFVYCFSATGRNRFDAVQCWGVSKMWGGIVLVLVLLLLVLVLRRLI